MTAKGISANVGVGRGRCSGSRANERSGLGLLDGEEGGGAPRHGGVARRRRRARLWRRCDYGSVGHRGIGRGGEAGARVRCPRGWGGAAKALRDVALARTTTDRPDGGVASAATSRCPSSAYWAIQVSQVSLSLSLLFPVFYFLQLFWLY